MLGFEENVLLTDQQETGDLGGIRPVSDLAARVKALQAMIREARQRGLTHEERNRLTELTRSVDELLRRRGFEDRDDND
jgi:hypothetical protein